MYRRKRYPCRYWWVFLLIDKNYGCVYNVNIVPDAGNGSTKDGHM